MGCLAGRVETCVAVCIWHNPRRWLPFFLRIKPQWQVPKPLPWHPPVFLSSLVGLAMSLGTPNRPYRPLIAPRGRGRLESPPGKKRCAIAVESAFRCIVRPWRIIKGWFWVFLLVGGIIRRPACFWGPEIVLRLNSCRLILVVHFKKISCPSTSTLKLKMLKINLKNILRSKIQENQLKFYVMSLITS